MPKLQRRKQSSKEEEGIKRTELLSVLDLVRPALDPKALISQSDHFIFSNDKISTYNNQLSVSVSFPIGIKGSVHADEFYNLIKESSCNDFEISREEGKLNIVGGGLKASFVFMEEEGEVERLIDSLDLDNLNWSELPGNFNEGLSLCSFSISNDVTSGGLYGVYISGNSVYSSDNLRISWFIMDSRINENILISGSAVKELLRYDAKEYFVDESWAHFRSSNNCIFSCQLMKDEFPGVEEFFGIDSAMEVGLPKMLIDVIKRVGILASGDSDIDKEIDIRIEKDKIICHGEKRGYGEIEEEMSFKGVEKPIVMRINPIFLSQILSKTNFMYYADGIDRVEFKSGDFRHVMSLVVEE